MLCVVVVVTYVSHVPLLLSSLSSSPRLWSFCRPRRIRPACPCRVCRQRLALRTTTTTTTSRASLIFRRAEHPKHQLHHDVFVVLVVPNCLRHRRRWCRPPEIPSQSRLSGTYKKSHVYSPDFTLASLLSSVVTLLPLLPSQSSHPMNRDDIDRGH